MSRLGVFLVRFTIATTLSSVFLQTLYYRYTGTFFTTVEMGLFVTHWQETFEAIAKSWSLFTLPFALFAAIGWWLFIRWGPGYTMGLFLAAFVMLWGIGLLFAPRVPVACDRPSTWPEPRQPVPWTVVLVVGESMRYDPKFCDSFADARLCRAIYAGGINTDVSVPLLIDGENDPTMILRQGRSLFCLARRNDMRTLFRSTQSDHNLAYILPLIAPQCIDSLETTPKNKRMPTFDGALLERLATLPSHTFAVLQMIGEHAPYIYFPGEKTGERMIDYKRAYRFSILLLRAMIETLRADGRPFIFIFTSDHGELTGEGGRWGHNLFDPQVYTVPLLIVTSLDLPRHLGRIACHADLYRFVRSILGYEPFHPIEPPYIVNGTMLDRQDGYITLRSAPSVP